jgi:RNA polymerase sigma-70 factor (sigma-E family)
MAMDFDGYVRARQRSLLRFAMVLTADPVDAEELLGDVLAVVFERWSLVAAADSPHAYVRRMLVNEFIRGRRRRRHIVLYDDLSGVGAPVEDTSAAHAERAALGHRLRSLPPRQRAAIALRYFEDLSFAQIAELLGSGENAVRSNISRGLRRLRIELDDDPARSPAAPVVFLEV